MIVGMSFRLRRRNRLLAACAVFLFSGPLLFTISLTHAQIQDAKFDGNLLNVNQNLVKTQDQDVRSLFKSIDTTSDGKLSVNEITWKLKNQINKHFARSIRTNMKAFMALDNINANGQVDWEEWYQNFIQKENTLDENSREFKEKVSAAKAAWSEAARSNPDNLNIDEFMAFTHSEFSHPLIMDEASNLISVLDENNDQALTLNEYISRCDKEEAEVRKEIFDVIDTNKDTKLTKFELRPTLDARTAIWAQMQVRHIMLNCDKDMDEFIDMSEFDVSQFTALSPDLAFHSVF